MNAKEKRRKLIKEWAFLEKYAKLIRNELPKTHKEFKEKLRQELLKTLNRQKDIYIELENL